jgi:hypothetical protein
MAQAKKSSLSPILVIGDLITLTLVTVIGFASHGEATSAGLRMLTTWIPLTVAWFLIAPFFGVYDSERTMDYRQLWRPFWAMVVAGPMAGWLRSVILGLITHNGLNTPILPIFVVVLGGFAALAMLAWRVIAAAFLLRKSRAHG